MPLKSLRHRDAAELEILLKLIARHEKIRPRRIEPRSIRIRRQFIHRNPHAEQFPQRIPILALVQSPHRDFAFRIAEIPARDDHHLRKIIEEIRLRLRRRLLLILRRHLTRIQRIEHLLPTLRSPVVADGKRQVIHAKLPFLLLSVVAGKAIILQQSPMLFRKQSARSLRSNRTQRANHREPKDHANQRKPCVHRATESVAPMSRAKARHPVSSVRKSHPHRLVMRDAHTATGKFEQPVS